jgi:hypothetical protein
MRQAVAARTVAGRRPLLEQGAFPVTAPGPGLAGLGAVGPGAEDPVGQRVDVRRAGCLPVKLHGFDGAPARAILRPIGRRTQDV